MLKEKAKSEKHSTRSIIRDILIAVLSAAIGSYTSCATQRASLKLEQEKLQFERTKLDFERSELDTQLKHQTDSKELDLRAQQSLEDVKLRKQHEEQALQQLSNSIARNSHLDSELAGKYHPIYVYNDCNEDLLLATRFAALDDSVIVRGWFVVYAGEHVFIDNTMADEFDLYAYGSKWKTQGDIGIMVSFKTQFMYIDDEYFHHGWLPLKHPEQVFFDRIKFDVSSGEEFSYHLDCK